MFSLKKAWLQFFLRIFSNRYTCSCRWVTHLCFTIMTLQKTVAMFLCCSFPFLPLRLKKLRLRNWPLTWCTFTLCTIMLHQKPRSIALTSLTYSHEPLALCEHALYQALWFIHLSGKKEKEQRGKKVKIIEEMVAHLSPLCNTCRRGSRQLPRPKHIHQSTTQQNEHRGQALSLSRAGATMPCSLQAKDNGVLKED